ESIKDDSKRKDAKSRRLAEIVVGAIITLVVTVVGSYLVYYLTHEDTVNVTVETTPAGAAIQLAGKKNESCTAPCTKGLPEGTYELIASLPGYMQEDRKIEVSKNGTPTVQITLTPLPDKGHGPDQDQRRTVKLPPPPPPPAGQAATLIVQTPGIKGAVAFVDNNEYPLPDWQTRIQVDKNKPHVIRVQKDGYENSAERQVTIAKKEEKVVFDLKALPEIATVSLRKATPGALVLLDDRTVGAVSSNGSFETKTSPGSHTVQLTLDGRTSEKIEQQVAARSTVVIPSLTVAKRETPPPPPDKHEKKEIAEDKAPQNQVVPDYCPMPGKPSFNYDSPYRDKVGVWKGAWVEMVTKEGKKAAITKTRRFCVVITSFRGAEAQAIYSTESAPPQPNVKTDPASYRAVTGVVSGQGRDMTITFTTAGDSRVVALQFLNNGTVKANWSQPSVQFALNAWVTKVK
ncbi:MAG: PEGA domain-containing protein, partial [Candidatus Korobacteraceae bacterium]